MIPRKPSLSLAVLVLAMALLQQTSVRAATATLHPTADTTLQEAFPNNNLGDGTSFTAGGRRQGGRTRGLMLFDVAGSVPAGSTISSVTLTLNITTTPSGGGANSVFDLHRVTASWGEGNKTDHGGSAAGAGESTWNSRFASTTPWTTPGGDFAAAVSGSRAMTGSGAYTFASTAGMVSDVQAWLTPGNNFGWILTSESESTPTSIRRFGSRDSGGFAPTLLITYTAVPEPATWILAGLGALGFCWVRRRR